LPFGIRQKHIGKYIDSSTYQVVDLIRASVVDLVALATALDRLSATYNARVKLDHAKFGSTMLAKNQSKTNMTRRMSMSVTFVVSTTRRNVA
jgi:hypothetical protein